MVIPIHEWPVCIDFVPFMDLLQEKYNFSMYDVAGSRSAEANAERQVFVNTWLKENGYQGMKHVLNKPEGSNEDWPRDSTEMALRIQINTEMRPKVSEYEENSARPYQNFWHWLTANPFRGFERGAVTTMDHSWNDEGSSAPEWATKIVRYIFEETKDHPANDGERIAFHIDW